MPSDNTDSHQFLGGAREAGAVAAVVHSEAGFTLARSFGLATAFIEPGTQPLLEGPTSSETPEQRIRRTTGQFSDALWRLAKVAFGDPSSKLIVFGVTGTNGKTTTAWLIRDIMNLLGVPCAYIGTLGFGLPHLPLSSSGERGLGCEGHWDEELRPLANTTPFTIELNAMLAEAIARGCKAVAMEVSSHALAERRSEGVEFDVAVFTNLSQDHLDYHGSMEAYEAAKLRLFTHLPLSASDSSRGEGVGGWGATPVINVGDPAGAKLADELGSKALRFLQVPKLTPFGGVDPRTDVEGCAFDIGLTQIHLVLQSKAEGDHGFFADLGGTYNVENLIAAVSAVNAAGHTLSEITEAITTLLRPVPGRFEPVPNDAGIGIIVDYAHTPDALDKLLETARPLTKGRIITVFGCGGDRDKSKRPLMAKAAERGSDIVVVTSDNPRTEDPDAIIADILAGLPTPHPPPLEDENPSRRGGVRIEPDRPAAVALAVKLAEPGDCVVIAGKGHENYQIIGRTKVPMDDRDLAREGLKQR
jgi:UDP-N-acetylmuramoyl-L-alanyl-D-glutamate--2,6-diaminopimelate ligase